MKAIAIVAVTVLAGMQAATGQPASTAGGSTCIRTDWIDHTKSPDDRTILFYMKDHKVWMSHLSTVCPELRFNGFIYSPTPPEQICGNLQTIRVIRSGSVCMMGPLEPYVPPVPPPDHS